MKNKVLIIGANSAVAKAVTPVLVENNTIVTAGRHDCDIVCDITKPFTILKDIDVVINFAAAFGGDTQEAKLNTQATNVQGILNICAASQQAKVKHLINISSIFALLDENSPFYTDYAKTKKQGDEVAEKFCQLNQLPLTILRPSQIYGDSDDFAKHQPFFYQIIDKAQKGEDIVIYGTNDARRNFIHVADVAEVIRRVSAEQITGTYACVQAQDVSYSQIAKAAQAVFGKGGEVAFDKTKPDIPNNIAPTDLEIYDKTNFDPKISLEIGIGRIKKYREGNTK